MSKLGFKSQIAVLMSKLWCLSSNLFKGIFCCTLSAKIKKSTQILALRGSFIIDIIINHVKRLSSWTLVV